MATLNARMYLVSGTATTLDATKPIHTSTVMDLGMTHLRPVQTSPVRCDASRPGSVRVTPRSRALPEGDSGTDRRTQYAPSPCRQPGSRRRGDRPDSVLSPTRTVAPRMPVFMAGTPKRVSSRR